MVKGLYSNDILHIITMEKPEDGSPVDPAVQFDEAGFGMLCIDKDPDIFFKHTSQLLHLLRAIHLDYLSLNTVRGMTGIELRLELLNAKFDIAVASYFEVYRQQFDLEISYKIILVGDPTKSLFDVMAVPTITSKKLGVTQQLPAYMFGTWEKGRAFVSQGVRGCPYITFLSYTCGDATRDYEVSDLLLSGGSINVEVSDLDTLLLEVFRPVSNISRLNLNPFSAIINYSTEIELGEVRSFSEYATGLSTLSDAIQAIQTAQIKTPIATDAILI